jgi:hypothetical protein
VKDFRKRTDRKDEATRGRAQARRRRGSLASEFISSAPEKKTGAKEGSQTEAAYAAPGTRLWALKT